MAQRLNQHKPVDDRPILTANQLWHQRVIGFRPLAVTCRQMFLAAHTVGLRNEDDFSKGELQPLESTVDIVLTCNWTTTQAGLPAPSFCYRVYYPRYIASENLAFFGYVCKVAKDGALMPQIRGDGLMFNCSRSNINFEMFMNMNAELESAARNIENGTEFQPGMHNKLLSSGPLLTDVYLEFSIHDFPKIWKCEFLQKDGPALEAIRSDILAMVQPGAEVPRWALSPGGKVSQVYHDPDNGQICIVFDGEEIVEVPSIAKLRDYVAVGAFVPAGKPLASMTFDQPCQTWEDVETIMTPMQAKWLVTQTFSASRIELTEKEKLLIPHRYVDVQTASMKTNVYRSLAGYVDPTGMSPVLGRFYHDSRNPPRIRRHEPACAPFVVWNMYGFPSKERLTFTGHGYKADFYTMPEAWQPHFEPGPRPIKTTGPLK